MKTALGSETLLLIISGLLIGFFIAAAMVFHGIWQIVAIVVICICFFLFVILIRRRRKKNQKGTKMVLMFIGLVVLGYLLYCGFIHVLPGSIKTGGIDPSETKDGAAVLLFSPGEIAEYEYKSALYQLNMKRRTGVGGITWWNTPVKALCLKKDIKRVKGEEYLQTGENLCNKLSTGFDNRLGMYMANLYGPPFIETTIENILKDGYNKIIILNNFLTECSHKEIIDKKILETLKKSGVDAEVFVSFPLWNHDALASHYEQCILGNVQETKPEQVGVMLVAKGSSKKARNRWPKAVKGETVFYNKIKESLMKNGYESRKVRVAYLYHRQPGVKDTVKYLLGTGINKLVVVAAGYESPCIDTEWIIPRILENVNLPEHMDIVFLGPWGDNEHLIRALLTRLDMVDAL